MKIAISADWHFNMYPNISRPLADGTTTRLRDVAAAWDWATHAAFAQGCKNHIVLGDVFDDRVTVELPVIAATCQAFQRAHTLGMTTRVLVGNHDAYLRDSRTTSLQALAGVAQVIDTVSIYEPEDGSIVVMVPWCDNEERYIEMLAEARAAAKGHKRRYLLTHATVGGLYPNTGVDPEAFKFEWWTQTILGDVHDQIQVADNATYTGSPLQLTFGDAGKPRGVTILDTKAGTIQRMLNESSPKFHVVSRATTKLDAAATDYVRVDSIPDDAKAVAKITKLRDTGTYVRDVSAPVDMYSGPRTPLTASSGDEEMLTTYATYRGTEAEALAERVATGLRLLKLSRFQ